MAIAFQRVNQQPFPKFSLNSFVSPSKPLYHAAQSGQFWTSPKDVKHPSTNCYFCNSTVQFLDVSCKRKCQSFQDKLQPVSSMSLEQNCFFLKGVLPCHWPWHILKTILNVHDTVQTVYEYGISKTNNTSLKEGWCIQYFLESQTELIKKRQLHV